MPISIRTLRSRCPETLVDTLDGAFGLSTWAGDTALWKTPAGPLRATISGIDAIAMGGRRVRGAITVIQQVLNESPRAAKEMVARHNTQPALGVAVVPSASPCTVDVVSRAWMLADEAQDWDKLGLNLSIAAISHMATCVEYRAGAPVKRLPHHDHPCRWHPSEFIALVAGLHDAGEVVHVGGRTLVAQLQSVLGWPPEALEGGDPRLALSGEFFHSVLGAGLAAEVSVSIDLARAPADRLARQLNLLELNRPTGPALFGAWAIDPTGQKLMYSSFWPNLGWVPALLPRIADWSVERLALVKDCVFHAMVNRVSTGS